MFTEHSITHLLKLPALSFPRVIIISPFIKTIYNKVAVHLKNARSIKLWPLIIFFSFDIGDFYDGINFIFVVYINSFMQMFHNNCSITNIIKCTLQSIRKRLFSGRKQLTVYTGPLPQLYGSFCTFSNWDLFKLLFFKHFLSQLLLCER
jgi:hypothetical protein